MKKIKSDFYIEHDRFQDLSDKAIGWFVKSFKYDLGSDECKICRLKQDILMRKALKHLKNANEYLYD